MSQQYIVYTKKKNKSNIWSELNPYALIYSQMKAQTSIYFVSGT